MEEDYAISSTKHFKRKKKRSLHLSLNNTTLLIWRRLRKIFLLLITNRISFFGWCCYLVQGCFLVYHELSVSVSPRKDKLILRHLHVSSVWATTTWDRLYHQLVTHAVKERTRGMLFIVFLVTTQQKCCSAWKHSKFLFPPFLEGIRLTDSLKSICWVGDTQ